MDFEKIKEMLIKYWYVVAGLVVYMMFGKKKKSKRRSKKSTRKMRAMRRANSRLKRQLMYSRMRRRR